MGVERISVYDNGLAIDVKTVARYASIYRQALLGDCAPFWEERSADRRFGGFLTCLDREGSIYSTEKSVWFQGRQTWMFAKLYNELEQKPEWLENARLGYEFLKKFCFDADGRMFFIVACDGAPLRKRRYCFSESFAVIAFAEYYKASGDAEALELARKTFALLVDIYEGRVKAEPKFLPAATPSKAMAMPMILLSTLQCLREADPDYCRDAGSNGIVDDCNNDKYDSLRDVFVNELLNDFLKPDEKALFETVGANGERLDSPAGRCINPGHSIEASWFLLKEGLFSGDKALIQHALDILDWSFDLGWDKVYGGLFSFVDIEAKPPQQLEWDMKLWWPHTEALCAFLIAAAISGDAKYFEKFELVHNYAFSHFSDCKYGEWFGYLHRDGTVSNELKGSLFKGFFHLPRALLTCLQLLDGTGL